MIKYQITEYLWLANKNALNPDEREDDPFSCHYTYDNIKDATEYIKEELNQIKELGLTYETIKVKANWQGNIPVGHNFVKGYKLTDQVDGFPAFDRFILVTSIEIIDKVEPTKKPKPFF